MLLGDSTSNSTGLDSVLYTTAKIVLVGDSGVGKTGLGWRLAHDEFREHASTHGQQFWVLDQLECSRADGARCEAVLWDLAGQPDYRLIHALHVQDADLALIVFDPTHGRDPLGSVEYWLQQLPPNCPKILVAARIDRGGPTLTRAELEQFCRSRNIAGGYVETSAADGRGLDDLLARMKVAIAWDRKTSITTTATFKRIKDFVLELKESRTDRRILLAPAELQELLRTQFAEKSTHGNGSGDVADFAFTEAEMMTAVERLASHGFVRLLNTSDGQSRILLVPELLNNLAASFVLEARRNPKGLGALEEHRLFDGSYRFGELDDLSPPDRELMLDATIVAFLDNRLSFRCFREKFGPTRLLVFPELMNLKKPLGDDGPFEDDVAYFVSGATENTYASLVVSLGYSNAFQRADQWHNQARYLFEGGLMCGFRASDDESGETAYTLFYSPGAGQPLRSLFQGLFESLMARKEFLQVRRLPPVACGQCGAVLDRSVVRKRLAEGKSTAFCNECGGPLQLPAFDEPLRLTRGLERQVVQQGRIVDRRVRFEKATYLLKRLVASKRLKSPTCFLSYAWGDQVARWREPKVEHWVARLADDLQKAGIDVVFDQRDNSRIGQSVPRFVERIASCDRVLVVGTPLYLRKYENRLSEAGSIVAAEMDLIADRLLGAEQAKSSVLPLLLAGNETASLPPSLRRRVYADFRQEERYFTTAFDLMLSLYDLPFTRPGVDAWRRMLQDEGVFLREPTTNESESDAEQLRAALRNALPRIGREARAAAFGVGQPVMILKNGRPTWVFPDGREEEAAFSEAAPADDEP